MPRFFIDVHADSLSDWDDDGKDRSSSSEAVILARELALDSLISILGSDEAKHVVAVVRDETNSNIATVTVGSGGDPKIVWT